MRTENVSVARKYFTLLKKTFNIDTENSVARNKSNGSIYYTVIIKKHENAIKVLQATKLMDGAGEISEEFSVSRNLLLQQSCCKRAFIRGAFLGAGSMSNPAKGYHLEIVCMSGKAYANICRRLLGEEIPITDFGRSEGLFSKFRDLFKKN